MDQQRRHNPDHRPLPGAPMPAVTPLPPPGLLLLAGLLYSSVLRPPGPTTAIPCNSVRPGKGSAATSAVMLSAVRLVANPLPVELPVAPPDCG